jgi:predicted DNA-binding transcriptional regulator AlpA
MGNDKRKPPTGGPTPPKQLIIADGDRLMTQKEVLERVRHKRSWLFKMMDQGKFPRGLRIGRRRFWLHSEVEEALNRLLDPM